MNLHQTTASNTLGRTFKAQVKDKVRKAEIWGWYLCYKMTTGPNKTGPDKSLDGQ